MEISMSSSGSFDSLEKLLKFIIDRRIFSTLEHFGADGVAALRAATPIDEGTTAASWGYEIVQNGSSWSIIWTNSHIVDGRPIAVLLQMGHGTGTGGWVEGRDYINPALKLIFDRIVDEAWKAVTSA